MKNNPFLPWKITENIIGMREERRLLSVFLDRLFSGKAGIAVCRGPPGTGKTTLLKLAQAQGKGAGALSAFVKAGKREKESSIVRALKAEFESELSKLSEGGDLAPSKVRLFSQEGVGTFNQLFSAIGKIVGRMPILIIVDDIDLAQHPIEILRSIAKDTEKYSAAVIVSTTKNIILPPGAFLIELRPVREEEFRAYVEENTRKGIRLGEECLKAIYTDSGGNPKVIQFVLWQLYDAAKETDKIITRAHYTANIRNALALLSHEWFSKQYFEASDEEKRILRRLAQVGEASVTELAIALRKRPGPVATLLLRLEARGDILKVARGRYKVFCPLYAKFILERS
ncbi:MAG: ATP-binding protein [Candidatus Bilamarchaeaceae archaeon]